MTMSDVAKVFRNGRSQAVRLPAAFRFEGDEVFKGIDWGSAPPLLGYNISSLKPTAQLSLISHRKDPIFAGWRSLSSRSFM